MSLDSRRPSADSDRPLPPAPSGRVRWTGRRAAALGLAAVATLGAAAPQPLGPQGLGDRLFPTLGNTGYDVTSYDVTLDYSGRNDQPLKATTEITAQVTTELDHLNLDFARGAVSDVKIDGKPAQHEQHGEDLVLTPASHMSRGQQVKIAIQHTSDPRGKSDGGWIRTSDGLAMANQADAAHRVFPCNDHPSDKALFTFHITAPQELTAVANGLPEASTRRAARRTWTYRTGHPMATELAQVSIGKSSVLLRHGPHGLPIRDVVPTADRHQLEKWLVKTPNHVSWMERKLGPYPFEAYGVLIADAQTGFELETQTLSLFEKGLFTNGQLPSWYVESVMVHELAHQWFGNSVSPRRWSDVWLNEAHATWYEALYAQEKGGRISLDSRMRSAYEQSNGWRAEGGPPAAPKAPSPGEKISLFRPVVYDGSALVLYALRQKIGTAAFDRLERAWVTQNRDGVADSADFIALSSKISGQDLASFFHGWLYGEHTPPMPGHQEWRPKKATGNAGKPARPGKPA
ncbi:M1 family metallopeptidase [Streptomyces sp. NPDC050355]|uniref:M1 family metallopeptidase n=1 Tax=Streptomyces sp. NPDC050355 TaxID=3365609 RepID=UPI0037A26322